MLCVTVVNTHPTQPIELALQVYQGRLNEVEMVTLAAHDIHAYNTLDQPAMVAPSVPRTIQARRDQVHVLLPACSVTRLMGRLG